MTTSADDLLVGPVEDPGRFVVRRRDLWEAMSGGEGIVYRARRVATGEEVGLKLLTSVTPAEYPGVEARARALTAIDHPNLMRQHETFLGCSLGSSPDAGPEEYDIAYSVVGWIDGRPLREAVGAATTGAKLQWIAELAAGLDALHSIRTSAAPHGMVHRDVKPSNVRVRPDGTAVLIDFGLTRPVAPNGMTEGAGTYLWRSPEVLTSTSGSTTASADVWGLGAVAYWLFLDEPPRLDGASAARERLRARLEALGSPDANRISRALSELLHSSTVDRPRDLLRWSRCLRARGRSARRWLGGATAAAAVLTVVVFPSTGRSTPGGSASAAPVARSPSLTASVPANRDRPAQITCVGRAIMTIAADPPVAMEPRNIHFSLEDPTNWIECNDGSSTVGRVRITSFDFGIADFSCRSFQTADPLQVYPARSGSARAEWDDGTTSDLSVTLALGGVGSVLISGVGGRYLDYKGSATFKVPFERVEGACDSGITRWNDVTIEGVTITPR